METSESLSESELEESGSGSDRNGSRSRSKFVKRSKDDSSNMKSEAMTADLMSAFLDFIRENLQVDVITLSEVDLMTAFLARSRLVINQVEDLVERCLVLYMRPDEIGYAFALCCGDAASEELKDSCKDLMLF
ncbi:hypothetical protein ACS0TY_035995 [Phlomoides rotata]